MKSDMGPSEACFLARNLRLVLLDVTSCLFVDMNLYTPKGRQMQSDPEQRRAESERVKESWVNLGLDATTGMFRASERIFLRFLAMSGCFG